MTFTKSTTTKSIKLVQKKKKIVPAQRTELEEAE